MTTVSRCAERVHQPISVAMSADNSLEGIIERLFKRTKSLFNSKFFCGFRANFFYWIYESCNTSIWNVARDCAGVIFTNPSCTYHT